MQNPNDEVVQTLSEESFGEITDVDTDVKKYITKKYLPWLIVFAVAVLIYEIIWFSYVFSTGHFSEASVALALIVFLPAGLFYGYIKRKMEDAFMEQFAIANGFAFQKDGSPGNLDGSLFSIGHGNSTRDLVTGTFQNLPLCLFNYTYTVGTGKESHTYAYSIFKLDYPTPLPPIFLLENGYQFGESISAVFAKSNPENIKLEGDFNKYFTVYAKKGFEIETLQIFSPDFMEILQTNYKNFSLEFINNHLYIYSHKIVSSKADLNNMYQLAQYLIKKIEPLAERMKNSLIALESV